MPNAALEAAAELLAGLSPEERERQEKQLRLLVAARLPSDALERPLPIRTLAEYLTAEIEEPPAIIDPPILVRGELTVTVGKSGKGKTSLNLNRVLRWAAGLPVFDELPDVMVPVDKRHVRTLLIENEGSAGMFQERMRAMFNAEDRLPEDARPLVAENVLIWGDGGYQGLKIDDDKDYAEIRRGVEKFKPDVLFIEPFRGLWRGDENSNTEVAEVIDRLIRLATDYRLGVILGHHERKNSEGSSDLMDLARGASALDGAAAAFENLRQGKGGDYRDLSWSKARYRAPGPIRMQYDAINRWYHYVPDSVGEREIKDFLQTLEGEPATAKAIADAMGEKYDHVSKVLTKLVQKGEAKRGNRGASGGVGYRLVTTDDEDNGGLPI